MASILIKDTTREQREQIVREMQILNESTTKIKDKMRGITENVNSISQAMEEVVLNTDKNFEDTNELGVIIESFEL